MPEFAPPRRAGGAELVLEAVTGAFVPIDFLRNGRPRKAVSGPGPFAEHADADEDTEKVAEELRRIRAEVAAHRRARTNA